MGPSAGRIAIGVALASIVLARPLRTLSLARQVPESGAGWLAALGVLAAAALAVEAVRDAIAGRRGGAVLLGATAGLCGIGTLAFARAPEADRQAIGAFLPYLELASFAWLWRRLAPGLDAIVRAFAIAGAVLAVSVILDAAGVWDLGGYGGLVPGPGQRRVLHRPAGWLVSRNYAGEWLAAAVPLALAAWGRSRHRLLAPAVLLGEGLALALTRCRTGWIAMFVGVAVLHLASRPDRRRLLLSGLVVVGMAGAFALPTSLTWQEDRPYLATLATLVELDSGSGRMRLDQHRATFELLHGRTVLGIGMGAWRDEMRRKEFALGMNAFPSSDLLRVLGDGGLLALGLAGLALGAALWPAVRARRAEALAPLAALAVVSLGDAALARPEVSMLWAALAAVLSCSGRIDGSPRAPRTVTPVLHGAVDDADGVSGR